MTQDITQVVTDATKAAIMAVVTEQTQVLYSSSITTSVNLQESLTQQQLYYSITLADSLQESHTQPGIPALILLHQWVFSAFNPLSVPPSYSLTLPRFWTLYILSQHYFNFNSKSCINHITHLSR